jgi:hypothetical protein
MKNNLYIKKKPFYNMKNEMDLSKQIAILNRVLPSHFMKYIDSVYLGDFPELKQRKVQAAFMDDCIYIDSFENSDDFLKFVVHEMAHSLFPLHTNAVEKEFIAKREILCDIMDSRDIQFPENMYYEFEHDENIDKFLHSELGYDKLGQLAQGIFLSPYSITSISEYWCIGFEVFFLEQQSFIKSVCPELFRRIEYIYDISNFNEELKNVY